MTEIVDFAGFTLTLSVSGERDPGVGIGVFDVWASDWCLERLWQEQVRKRRKRTIIS